MKLSLCIGTLLCVTFAFGQQLQENLNLAVKESRVVPQDSLVKLTPDLSYYSRNYHKVFKNDYYNLDVLAYAARAVFFDFNYRGMCSDPNTPHIFRVMPLAGVNVDPCMAQPSQSGYAVTGRQ